MNTVGNRASSRTSGDIGGKSASCDAVSPICGGLYDLPAPPLRELDLYVNCDPIVAFNDCMQAPAIST